MEAFAQTPDLRESLSPLRPLLVGRRNKRGTELVYFVCNRRIVMHIVETQIREEGGSNPAFRVEFSGDGGEVISVLMRQNDGLNRENAVAKARALMIQIGSIDSPSEYQPA
jgi:hypothetical protein